MIRQTFAPSDCGGGRRKSSFLRWTIWGGRNARVSWKRAEAHPLKTLPPVHPREPPVTASSAAATSRLNASHACTVCTLREDRINHNGKLMFSCAEAVEDGTSLWKGKENWKQTGPRVALHIPIESVWNRGQV